MNSITKTLQLRICWIIKRGRFFTENCCFKGFSICCLHSCRGSATPQRSPLRQKYPSSVGLSPPPPLSSTPPPFPPQPYHVIHPPTEICSGGWGLYLWRTFPGICNPLSATKDHWLIRFRLWAWIHCSVLPKIIYIFNGSWFCLKCEQNIWRNCSYYNEYLPSHTVINAIVILICFDIS